MNNWKGMELGEGTSNSQAKRANALGIKIYELGGISSSKKKRLCRPFRDGIRFFEKYKDKLSCEIYRFLYFKKKPAE